MTHLHGNRTIRGVPGEGESLSRQPHKRSPGDYVIDFKTGCWEWQKGTLRGYGTGSFRSAGITTQFAHRAYYEAANGPIPDGLHLHHRCHNPGCVNPAHLEPVEQPDHTGAHQRFISGLDWDKVQEIRSMGPVSLDVIVERYGIGRTDAFYILSNERWHDPEYVPGWVVACELCGSTFRTLKSTKRFCSPEHRQQFNNLKRVQIRREAA